MDPFGCLPEDIAEKQEEKDFTDRDSEIPELEMNGNEWEMSGNESQEGLLQPPQPPQPLSAADEEAEETGHLITSLLSIKEDLPKMIDLILNRIK